MHIIPSYSTTISNIMKFFPIERLANNKIHLLREDKDCIETSEVENYEKKGVFTIEEYEFNHACCDFEKNITKENMSAVLEEAYSACSNHIQLSQDQS
jgi:hypothetical protein